MAGPRAGGWLLRLRRPLFLDRTLGPVLPWGCGWGRKSQCRGPGCPCTLAPVTATSPGEPAAIQHTVSEARGWRGVDPAPAWAQPSSSCVPPAPPRPTPVTSWPHLIGVWATAGNLGPRSAHSIVAGQGPQHLGASLWMGGAWGTTWCLGKGPREGSKLYLWSRGS